MFAIKRPQPANPPSLAVEGTEQPPVQESMEEPSMMGLAATPNDDNRTPSPTKAVRFGPTTFGETADKSPPSPSNSEKEVSPEASASRDSSGATFRAVGPRVVGTQPKDKPHVQNAFGGQVGLAQDVKKLQPPPPGHGKKVLRPKELEGLPEQIQVEPNTGNLFIDFIQFKDVNPQYSPRTAWNWFKDIQRRYGQEITDKDWEGDPDHIGSSKTLR